MEGICQECVNYWQEINSPETLQEMCIFKSSHGRRKPVKGGVTWSHVLCISEHFQRQETLEVLYDQVHEGFRRGREASR